MVGKLYQHDFTETQGDIYQHAQLCSVKSSQHTHTHTHTIYIYSCLQLILTCYDFGSPTPPLSCRSCFPSLNGYLVGFSNTKMHSDSKYMTFEMNSTHFCLQRTLRFKLNGSSDIWVIKTFRQNANLPSHANLLGHYSSRMNL